MEFHTTVACVYLGVPLPCRLRPTTPLQHEAERNKTVVPTYLYGGRNSTGQSPDTGLGIIMRCSLLKHTMTIDRWVTGSRLLVDPANESDPSSAKSAVHRSQFGRRDKRSRE